MTGDCILHRGEEGGEYLAKVSLDWGNIVCLPSYVTHAFKPSDTGLVTINMTDELITSQTADFGAEAPRSLDGLPVRTMHAMPIGQLRS